MTVYRVHCKKHIHTSLSAVSTEDVWVSYELELPFVPFNGLVVVETDDLWITLEQLHWRDDHFFAYSEDKTFYNLGEGATKQAVWDHVKENHLDLGWQIEEGGMLWPRCPVHGFQMTPTQGSLATWECRGDSGHRVMRYEIDMGYTGL